MIVAENEREESSTRKFKSVCVFGSPKLGKDLEFIGTANRLGRVLAARGINMVYGGGVHGIRACAAASALLGGSNVLGIFMKGVTNGTFGIQLGVSNMHECLGYMFCNAEAFIALPGGSETLEGISSVLLWVEMYSHKKPIGLLNVNGFYDGLLSFLDHAAERHLIPPKTRRIIVSTSDVDLLIDQLQICASQFNPLMGQADERPSDGSRKRKLDTDLRL